MVNTRNSQCNGQPSNNKNNNNNNAHLEQLLTTQTQLMQTMLQTLNNMQPNQQQVPPPPPPHQSRLAEFLRTGYDSHGLAYLKKSFNKSSIICSQSKKTPNITDTCRRLPTQHILNLARIYGYVSL
jgi:hypothetical protein